jgi:hypothetical protein
MTSTASSPEVTTSTASLELAKPASEGRHLRLLTTSPGASHENHTTESLPLHLQRYADEVDEWQRHAAQVQAARRARRSQASSWPGSKLAS